MRFVAEQKVRHMFLLSGGGCMHLVDSMGKNKKMIKEEGRKDGSRHKKGDGPGCGDIMTASFEVASKNDEPALGPDRGDAVEGRSHPDKGRLEVLRKPQHVKAVRGGVMGC